MLPPWAKVTPIDCSSYKLIEQKKALRILFKKPHNHHCKELFNQHKLFTIPSLYIFEAIKYAICNNILNSQSIEPDHGHFTRHNFVKNSIADRLVLERNVTFSSRQLFNALPVKLKKCLRDEGAASFLNSLKNFLLEEAFYKIKEFL